MNRVSEYEGGEGVVFVKLCEVVLLRSPLPSVGSSYERRRMINAMFIAHAMPHCRGRRRRAVQLQNGRHERLPER